MANEEHSGGPPPKPGLPQDLLLSLWDRTLKHLSLPFDVPSPEELTRRIGERDFKVLEIVGWGGMGVVYKAVRLSIVERTVAIKLLPAEMALVKNRLDRFINEMEALRLLAHSHIVRSYEFGQTKEGDLYFWMEYIDTSLRKLLRREGRLAPAQALLFIRQLCDALQAAHEKEIIHRDIKPENILIASEDCVKLADFGVARVPRPEGAPRPTIGGTRIGDERYEAPEVKRGGPASERSDLYALGLVLYEMLTGKLPEGAFPKASSVSLVDERVDAVIRRAIEMEPGNRYASAGEMKMDLDLILATPGARMRMKDFSSARGARRLAQPLAIAALAAALAVAGYLGWNREKERRISNGNLPTLATPAPLPAATPIPPVAATQAPVVVVVPPPAPGGAEAGERRVFGDIAFRWCPPGEFDMGSPGNEVGRSPDETLHRVILTRGFWMAETTVTQDQWEAVMDPGDGNPSLVKGKDLPVENMERVSAVVWCDRKGRLGGLPAGWKYNLPTEAQWEYACRAGTHSVYFCGDTLSRSQANFKGAPPEDELGGAVVSRSRRILGQGGPVRVASYPPNNWGLYDMHGNVWQWCMDWYGPYPQGPVTDPEGSDASNLIVYRGGCWNSDAATCRAAKRHKCVPNYKKDLIGFRPVVVLKNPGG